MKQLLAQARKRVIAHLVLDKGALALTIGMGGAVLLLLIGTQILDWYWPVLLAAASLGIGIWQLRKYIPTQYQLAQRIDHKLALADSLSTAVYFSEHPRPGLENVCAAQYALAERMAGGVNVGQALPLERSRWLIPAAALLAAAGGLFIARYFVTGSMDLNGSLLDMVVDNFFASPAEEAAVKSRRPDLRPQAYDPSQPETPGSEEQLPPPDAQKGTELNREEQSTQQGGEGEKNSQDQQEEAGGDEDGSDENSPQDKQGNKQDREGDDKGQNDSQGDDQRSMLDKLRDAVNNLVNKMTSDSAQKMPPKGGEKQSGKQQQDKGQKNRDEGEKGDGEQSQNAQGEQDTGQDSKQSNAPGQKSSEDAKSGAGQDDGKKDIEDAKALEAMGEISELLGERATGVTGDMMIEVGTTKQQLRTAMTQQSAGHTDAGGEIHRDQVPLAYQSYIERYFQDIRKAPAAPKAAPKGKQK